MRFLFGLLVVLGIATGLVSCATMPSAGWTTLSVTIRHKDKPVAGPFTIDASGGEISERIEVREGADASANFTLSINAGFGPTDPDAPTLVLFNCSSFSEKSIWIGEWSGTTLSTTMNATISCGSDVTLWLVANQSLHHDASGDLTAASALDERWR